MFNLINDIIDNSKDNGKITIIDGKVNVDGDFYLRVSRAFSLKKLPVQFGVVNGMFNCANVGLTTLIGCPVQVDGIFSCTNNEIESLVGGPKIVKNNYACFSNDRLTSFDGLPDTVGRIFVCDWKENLHMLRLLQFNQVTIYENKTVGEIILKYAGKNHCVRQSFNVKGN